jgi:hypothetical protein
VIDNRPLQIAAWSELLRARQRLEKATRDIHRHEETDEPALRAWLANTFPTLISAAREVAAQLEAKSRIVQAVEDEAFLTGKRPAQIWREWERSGGRPPEAQTAADDGRRDPLPPEASDDPEAAFEEEINRLFAEEGVEDNDPFADVFRNATRTIFGLRARPAAQGVSDARAIYRRLVQHLHPDRGGEWTPARSRLWEQVQEAWNASDADWLARLEAEWEAHADLLGPTSPLGKLRAAIAELEAARRDAETRVRAYRRQHAWQFSLQPPSAGFRARLKRQLLQEEALLRAQLEEIEATMARWKYTPRRRQPNRRRHTMEQWNFGF